MNDTGSLAKILGGNPGAAADSPLSSLQLPGRLLQLLEDGGFTNVGELAVGLEDDPKSILDINGIGPKALLSIRTALEGFANEPVEEYREPVQSLGDQFKSFPTTTPSVTEVKVETEKKTDQKPEKADKKKGKKSKKAGKKKVKESKMADKKKDKKSKKSDKKKDKKSEKKKSKK